MRILRPDEIKHLSEWRDLTPDELAQAYELAKAAFTAQDLQQYTEEWQGVPMEDVIKELEARQRQLEQRRA